MIDGPLLTTMGEQKWGPDSGLLPQSPAEFSGGASGAQNSGYGGVELGRKWLAG